MTNTKTDEQIDGLLGVSDAQVPAPALASVQIPAVGSKKKILYFVNTAAQLNLALRGQTGFVIVDRDISAQDYLRDNKNVRLILDFDENGVKTWGYVQNTNLRPARSEKMARATIIRNVTRSRIQRQMLSLAAPE